MKNVKPDVLAAMNRLQRNLVWWSGAGLIIAVLALLLVLKFGPLWCALSGLGVGVGIATGSMSYKVRKTVERLIGEWAINGGEN